MINSTRVINEPCISHILAHSAAYSETVNQIAAELKAGMHFYFAVRLHSLSSAGRKGGKLMEHRKMEREDIFRMIEGGKSHNTGTSEGILEDRVYTVKDIEVLPEGERAELIDGKMYMMATPTLTHQELLGWLYFKIRMYITEKGGPCRVILSPFGVFIKDDERNYVEPDITVICDMEKLDEKGCHGAPDWAIEIVSPSSKTMDYIRKCALYEQAGVREYWIVDPKAKSVLVYNFEHGTSGRYTFSELVKAGIYEDLFLDFGEVA